MISGNGDDGIEIDDVSGGNVIRSNTIGLGVDGQSVVANGRHGVVLYNGANSTLVGGSAVGEGNVVSGNAQQGVHVNANSNAATADNVIAGNFIGTDRSGLLDRGNGTERGPPAWESAADGHRRFHARDRERDLGQRQAAVSPLRGRPTPSCRATRSGSAPTVTR